MAIYADQFACLVRSILSRGLMTLFALEFEMFTLQLERTLLMRLAREERRFEFQLVMAGVTLCAGRATFELPVVNVFVAVAAERMRYGSSEIVVLVALGAVGFGMFSM